MRRALVMRLSKVFRAPNIVASALALSATLMFASTDLYAQESRVPEAAHSPPPPSAGDERDVMIRKVRAAAPEMPEHLVFQFVDFHSQINDNSSCELLEWITSHETALPAPARQAAALNLATCRLPSAGLTADAARAMLDGKTFAVEVAEGVLTVVTRSTASDVRICCSIQGEMERIGDSEFWVQRRRLPDADRGMLSFMSFGSNPEPPIRWRGPLAPEAPPLAAWPLRGQRLERQIASEALGETRKLSIYLPPEWSPDRTWPVVYLTDGAALVFSHVLEPMIAEGTIPPLVLVSALPAPFGVVGEAPPLPMDLRSAEYINRFPGGAGQDRFDRHMSFFAEELTDYARKEFAVSSEPEDVAVAGYSNGGVFALWAGLQHPETFGGVIAMSPGMVFIEPTDLAAEVRARFQVSGGLYEPTFAKTARTTEATLREAGFDVMARYPAAGHAQDQWEYVFSEAIKGIFSK